MLRGGRDREQSGCPVVTLNDIIVFTEGVTKHALNFQERYSQDGRSTTAHTVAINFMAFIGILSPPPPPPLRLILPFSSRLLPKSCFQMSCH